MGSLHHRIYSVLSFMSLRFKVVEEAFKKHPDYDKLFKDGLFKELLPALIENSSDSPFSLASNEYTFFTLNLINISNRSFL